MTDLSLRTTTVEHIHDAATALAAADLLRDIWRTPHGWPVAPELLLVLAHTGNYACVARVDGQLVAASAALRTGDDPPQLHSHITGVADGHRGCGVGRAMKRHQRGWALEQGISTISWTFDPLQRRNAAFNVVHLGARITRYLPDFYGIMSDEINRGSPSDRAYVEWDLRAQPSASVREAPGSAGALVEVRDGRPVAVGPPRLPWHTLAVPTDVVSLRQEQPDVALAWQDAVRESFRDAMAAGYAVVGFDRERHYVLTRP